MSRIWCIRTLRQVHYGFDNGGRIADIATKPSGGATSTILSRIQYAPHGQVSSRAYANGVEIPFVYNANQLYRLTRIGNTSGGVQSLSYTYDSDGNILTLADASASTTNHSITFTYDDLNRLTEASTTAATSTPFREMYRYNALGNLLYKGIATTIEYQRPLARPRIEQLAVRIDQRREPDGSRYLEQSHGCAVGEVRDRSRAEATSTHS